MSYNEAVSRAMQVLCMLADRNGGKLEISEEEMVLWSDKLKSGMACLGITHQPDGPWIFESLSLKGRADILRELLKHVEEDEKQELKQAEPPPQSPETTGLTEEDKSIIRLFNIKP
jgi:hypothetical protein